jgi:hypothetical protein
VTRPFSSMGCFSHRSSRTALMSPSPDESPDVTRSLAQPSSMAAKMPCGVDQLVPLRPLAV